MDAPNQDGMRAAAPSMWDGALPCVIDCPTRPRGNSRCAMRRMAVARRCCEPRVVAIRRVRVDERPTDNLAGAQLTLAPEGHWRGRAQRRPREADEWRDS